MATLLPSIAYTVFVFLILQRCVEPRLFDRRRYNALLTAIIIFGLADIAGVTGLILGAPLAAAVQIAGRQWMRRRLSAGVEPPVEESFSERLLVVRAALERRERPPPELTNLVDRLAALATEAEAWLETSVGRPARRSLVSNDQDD